MHNFPFSFAAGLAAAALVLAGPAAQAQSTNFITTELTASSAGAASIRPTNTNGIDSPSRAVRSLSAPHEAATAVSYNDSHKELQQALTWVQETNALHPEYWSVYAEARIRLQLKDYAGAEATAAEAKELALAAGNADYARRSDEVMAQAKARRH